MNQITTWLQDTFGFDPETQRRLLASIVAIVVIWAIRRIVLVFANRQIEDLTSRYRIQVVIWLGSNPLRASGVRWLATDVICVLSDSPAK